jgi:hypothetical protein
MKTRPRIRLFTLVQHSTALGSLATHSTSMLLTKAERPRSHLERRTSKRLWHATAGGRTPPLDVRCCVR